LLRKLATANLVKKSGGMNAGQFFAMAPESRQDAMTLIGGARMAYLNQERRTLTRNALSTPELQNLVPKINARSNEVGESYTRVTSPTARELWEEYRKALAAGDKENATVAWRKYQAERTAQPTTISSGTKMTPEYTRLDEEEKRWRKTREEMFGKAKTWAKDQGFPWNTNMDSKFGNPNTPGFKGGTLDNVDTLNNLHRAAKEAGDRLAAIARQKADLASSGRATQPTFATYMPTSATGSTVASDAAAKSIANLDAKAASAARAFQWLTDTVQTIIPLLARLTPSNAPGPAATAPTAATPPQAQGLAWQFNWKR